jgi:hypothetical protein
MRHKKIGFIKNLIIGHSIAMQQFRSMHDYLGLFWMILGNGWLAVAIYAAFKVFGIK